MTLHDIQRAQLACFAVQESGPRGSLDQMKAIAFCIRNRVRQGWYDGDWLRVLEHADEVRGNDPWPRIPLNGDDRSFQRLIADIDEIYFSRRDWVKDPSNTRMPDMEEAIGNACYWLFIHRPATAWFQENILAQPGNHPQHAGMGVMLFFE